MKQQEQYLQKLGKFEFWVATSYYLKYPILDEKKKKACKETEKYGP